MLLRSAPWRVLIIAAQPASLLARSSTGRRDGVCLAPARPMGRQAKARRDRVAGGAVVVSVGSCRTVGSGTSLAGAEHANTLGFAGDGLARGGVGRGDHVGRGRRRWLRPTRHAPNAQDALKPMAAVLRRDAARSPEHGPRRRNRAGRGSADRRRLSCARGEPPARAAWATPAQVLTMRLRCHRAAQAGDQRLLPALLAVETTAGSATCVATQLPSEPLSTPFRIEDRGAAVRCPRRSHIVGRAFTTLRTPMLGQGFELARSRRRVPVVASTAFVPGSFPGGELGRRVCRACRSPVGAGGDRRRLAPSEPRSGSTPAPECSCRCTRE